MTHFPYIAFAVYGAVTFWFPNVLSEEYSVANEN